MTKIIASEQFIFLATYECANKNEYLFLAGLFQPSLMVGSKVVVYLREALFRCSTLEGRLLALSRSIRLGHESLPGTNILAYYAHSKDTEKIKYCEYDTWL
jgi:hypothetical protein